MVEHGFAYESVGRPPVQRLRRSTDRETIAVPRREADKPQEAGSTAAAAFSLAGQD
jgi:hypothetical protein